VQQQLPVDTTRQGIRALPRITRSVKRNAHHTLRRCTQLTTGRPAALEQAVEAERVAQDLAWCCAVNGPARAINALPFLALFCVLASDHIAIYADSETYPNARWGIERWPRKGSGRRHFGCMIRRPWNFSCVEIGGRVIVRLSSRTAFTRRPGERRR